jgi:hypothetical protein
VISLTTDVDYLNNIKWTKDCISADDGDNLLESREQFEITVDLADLSDGLELSDNLTANDSFSE